MSRIKALCSLTGDKVIVTSVSEPPRYVSNIMINPAFLSYCVTYCHLHDIPAVFSKNSCIVGIFITFISSNIIPLLFIYLLHTCSMINVVNIFVFVHKIMFI